MRLGELLISFLIIPVTYSVGTIVGTRGRKPETSLADAIIVSILLLSLIVAKMVFLVTIRIWLIIGWTSIIGLLSGLLRNKIVAEEMGAAPQDQALSLWGKIKVNWSQFAERLGNFQGRLLLILFYFVIALPFGLLVKLFRNPIRKKKVNDPTFWTEKFQSRP